MHDDDRRKDRIRTEHPWLIEYTDQATHDMRKVVRHIGVFTAEALTDAVKGTKQREHLDRVLERIDALDEMIRSLQHFSYFSVICPDRQTISARDLIAETFAAMSARLGNPLEQSSLRLTGDAVLKCDANMLASAIYAVLQNAVFFGDGRERGIDVAISIENDAHVLRFADRGPGVDAERAQKLFEPFEKDVRKGHAPRMGLGLAICRLVAQAHGGSARFVIPAPAETGAVLEISLPQDGADARGFL